MKPSKGETKDIVKHYNKNKDMLEKPSDCYCDMPIYDEDNPIGETDAIYKIKFSSPFSLPIYKCKNCGKNLIMPPLS